MPLWKFRYVDGGEEEEEGDGMGQKEPLEITSLRFVLKPIQNYLKLTPSWSPCYSDLFAAGYGSFDFYSQSEAHSKQNHHYDKDDNEDNDYNSCRAATSPSSP